MLPLFQIQWQAFDTCTELPVIPPQSQPQPSKSVIAYANQMSQISMEDVSDEKVMNLNKH